jgi:sugar phosphate isomerase/epimerase
MNPLSRRHFLCAGALGAAAAWADPLGLPIGCQTYPVREALGKDFPGTLRQLAGIGYKAIEMCSPPGYAKSGYGSLVDMKAAEMRGIIQSAGLRCESCHYQFRELKENFDERAAFAHELGLKQMIVASFGMRKDAALADWAQACDEMNRIGEKANKAGLQLGFHNHHGEFEKIGGVLIYDELLRRLDPKLVKMQFQVAVISAGIEAVPYFKKYPGRFLSLHLADWSSTEKTSVPVGKGAVDWKQLFGAAKTGGVKNYFVEMNMDALAPSFEYLKGLRS